MKSLEQQTATAKVLQVISRSTFDLQTVLSTLVESATRLCVAGQAALFLREGDVYRMATTYGFSSDVVAHLAERPLAVDRTSMTGRVALEGKAVHIHDVLADPEYRATDYQQAFGYRTNLGVPLLRDGTTIGVFALVRSEVDPFTEKQIELVTTFADQAVIAIENARLLTELRESLEQQTATADVLGVINASRGDLQPVFEAMVDKARRLCEADAGHLALPVGDDYRSVAVSAMSTEMTELIQSISYAPGRGTAIGRALAERRPVQISDIGADNEHAGREAAHRGFIRTILGVPLLREGEAIGAFGLSRQRVEPFTDRQIELVRTFADQAVIAIENTRLFKAEQERTKELTESLAQQTATSEVLGVISSSPGDLKPVFDAMLSNAVRLCEAQFGNLLLHEDGAFRFSATYAPAVFAERWQREPVFRPSPLAPVARAVASRDVVHVANVKEDPAYLQGDPPITSLVDDGGARTILCVPMIKDAEVIGALSIFRQEIRPFTEKQIDLVKNFAAQAVIAIENTRLLTELRKSLEQQTATAEVLSVINSSPGDLTPVFDAMVEKALRLCQAKCGALAIFEGDHYRAISAQGPAELAAAIAYRPIQIHPESAPARLRRGEDVVHVQDIANTSALPQTPSLQAMIDLGKARTALWVSLRKDDAAVGFFSIYRQEVRPFSEREIDLVRNFAAQAVIAIENARLLTELRESLAQQTATSDVLEVISGSPGDVAPVFKSVLKNATSLCDAKFGALYLADRELFRPAALQGATPELAEYQAQRGNFVPPTGSLLEATASAKSTIQQDVTGREQPSARLGGARSALAVPMLKDKSLVGAIIIYRQDVSAFTDKQIALVENFAAQAVIAIENTRLLTELRKSLEQQTATAEVLGVISSSPGDLEPVFAAMLENAVRICHAKFGNISRWDGEALHLLASHKNTPPALVEARRQSPHLNVKESVLVLRMLAAKTAVQVPDASLLPGYLDRSDQGTILSGGLRRRANCHACPDVQGERTGRSVHLISRRGSSLYRQGDRAG